MKILIFILMRYVTTPPVITSDLIKEVDTNNNKIFGIKNKILYKIF